MVSQNFCELASRVDGILTAASWRDFKLLRDFDLGRQVVRRRNALGKSPTTEFREIFSVAFCQLTAVVLHHSDGGQ
jgi:hypothetical protein